MSDVMQVCIPCTMGGTLPLGTHYILGGKAPTSALGGGITVVSVDYCANAAIAAASAPTYTLVKANLGGTTVNGTIATTTGSVAWTAGTSKVGTLSTVFVDAGEQFLVLAQQTAENAAEPIVTCVVQYVMGR
jgi:hypothetical protein